MKNAFILKAASLSCRVVDLKFPNIKGYNGAVGPFQAKVNMRSVEPPQRKDRMPQYSRDKLAELQQMFNQLVREVRSFQAPRRYRRVSKIHQPIISSKKITLPRSDDQLWIV